jgi:hypothetical protein
MAREKGYVLFPIQARDFVNQSEPMSDLIRQVLLDWIDSVGENLLKSIPARVSNFGSLYNIAKQSGEEKVVKVLAQLVQELTKCTTKPIVVLIDQCYVFHSNPLTIKIICRW